jgi:NAD(P)-dependent dehydrogenase (short-subunit alcohol dehydrogenase family)
MIVDCNPVVLNPTTFWAAVAALLVVGGHILQDARVLVALAAPCLWARLWRNLRPSKDPTDALVVGLAGLFLVGAALTHVGFGTHFVVAFAALWAVAYTQAPRRTFPTAEAYTAGQDLQGKVALVTGPTSGIGQETARVLALRGARVVLASRNEAKLKATQTLIEASVPGAQVDGIRCDLADLVSVRACAAAFEKLGTPLHYLINNAGVMAMRTRQETAQGLEFQIGVNHVGHFLLAKLLTPKLIASKPSRVVCLSSSGHWRASTEYLDKPTLELIDAYDPWTNYGNSKYANILFAQEFHRRYGGPDGVSAFSCNPGAIFTGLQDEVPAKIMFKWLVVAPFFFKSTAQGCATTLFCTLEPGIEDNGGKYFDNCAVGVSKQQDGQDMGKLLWERTENLIAARSKKTN